MCLNCLTVETNFDQTRKAAFGEKLLNVLNSGALAIMLSVGHRTKLFDVMSQLPPSTSSDIASSAQLNERYVREWLGAMVSAKVVDYFEDSAMYYLPKEHAAFLKREAGSDNIATLSQYIPLLGAVEDQVVKCFESGGGVPYSEFKRFHEVMADDSGQSVLPALFDKILPLIPSIGSKLERGIKVLDLGCGRGKALIQLAEQYPQSIFLGYDISEEAIAWAKGQALQRRLGNIHFIRHDAAEVQEEGEFDLIFTFDAIHDQAAPQVALDAIYRALKPGGVYLMQDIGLHSSVKANIEHPIATLIYTISCMHCMTVSLASGGAGLGAAWGVELAESMLRKAGFQAITMHRLEHDIQNAYFVCGR